MSDSSTHSKRIGRFLWIVLSVVAVILVVGAFTYSKVFGPTNVQASSEEFLVQEEDTVDQIAQELTTKGFVRTSWIFQIA